MPKSHLIFQNFLGEPPRPSAGARTFGARFGASPPYVAPLSKIPGSAPDDLDILKMFLHTENEVAMLRHSKLLMEDDMCMANEKKYKIALKVKGQGQMSATFNRF